MIGYRKVTTIEAAKYQLLRLRKTTAEKYSSASEFVAYLVDGLEYSAEELIWLANSVVSKAMTRPF
jgi:hypothetical protein